VGVVLLVSGEYTEQVNWRDAATGRLLAESDFFEPLTLGSLTTPGFGGRTYFPSGKGFITCRSCRLPRSEPQPPTTTPLTTKERTLT
jgi:hypothetical protein